MEAIVREKLPSRFLLFFALFWVFLGWLGLIITWAGYFHSWIFIAYFIAAAALLVYCFKKGVFRLSSEFVILSIFLILTAAIIASFSTPSVFSGRDQGSISEAAVRLSQNHQLEFSTPASNEFFKIYGTGKALNFPGFYYTDSGNLTTQFPLPYISWLTIFYSLFGLTGLIIANAVLFYLFFLYFYFLARIFLEKKYCALLLILTGTSFSFSWFSKFTLSENMALSLFWISIFSFLVFFRERSGISYFTFLSSSFLLFFTRIEGIAFLAAGMILMLFLPNIRNFIKKNWIKKLIIPFSLLAVFLLWNIFADTYFYKEIAKALLSSFSEKNLDLKEKYIFPFFNILQVYVIYGIFPFLILGLTGIGYFIKKRKLEALIPFLIAFPSFWYLIDSNISSDHPWMLRRFVFSILPILIFYTVLLLAKWKEKNEIIQKDLHIESISKKTISQIRHVLACRKNLIFYSMIAILLFFNLPSFLKYAFFSENKGLLEQVGELGKNFSNNDLVLIDRKASGDGWSMISGPMNFMFAKNSVYFFNSADLDKIDLEKFDKVYLITPEENINIYKSGLLASRLKYFKNYTLKTERIGITSQKKFPAFSPSKENVNIKGEIFEILK